MTALLLALALETSLAEARYDLPSGLLLAVCVHESRGRNLITRELGGHCSIGPAQVLVRGCERARLRRLLVLSVNADAGAQVASWARETCRKHPGWACCRDHWIGCYNSRSPGYARRVLAVWRRLIWRPRRGEI